MSENVTAVGEMLRFSVKIREMPKKSCQGKLPKNFSKNSVSRLMTIILCCLLLNVAYLCFTFIVKIII